MSYLVRREYIKKINRLTLRVMNKGLPRLAALIFVCAIIVRAVGIPTFFFSPDELMDLGVSQGASLVEVLHRSTVEVHPPLEQFMKRLLLAGTDNVMALRTAYCFFGIMAVCALSLAAYNVGGLNAGLTCFTIAAFVPACVSISLLVRGYGIFLLAISLALREFFLLCKDSSPSKMARSWALAVWLSLACMTNFAGFPFACAVLLTLAWLRASKRISISLRLISAIAAVIALEGATVWWWYFSPGTGAHEWRILSRSAYFEQCSQFQSLSVWVLRLLTLFAPLPLHAFSPEILVGIGVALVLVYMSALARVRSTHPEILVFACVTWVVSTALNFAGIYPLVGPRHSIWLLPSILIPLAIVSKDVIAKRPGFTALIVVAITIFSLNGVYVTNNNDFPLPVRNYEAAREFISREIAPDDVIVTSRFGLLYALYEQDQLRTFYEPSEPIYTTSFLEHRLLASTPGRRWQLTQQDVAPLVRALQSSSTPGTRVWLLSLGFKDHVMERMRRCAEERRISQQTMDVDGVSIIGFNSGDFTRLFGPSGDCFANYKDNLCAERI